MLYDNDMEVLIAFPADNAIISSAAFTVPDEAVTIKAGAFIDSSIVGIVLPQTITTIEGYAFNSPKCSTIYRRSATRQFKRYHVRGLSARLLHSSRGLSIAIPVFCEYAIYRRRSRAGLLFQRSKRVIFIPETTKTNLLCWEPEAPACHCKYPRK